MMKKWVKLIAFLLAVLMLGSAFAACKDEDVAPEGDGGDDATPPAEVEKAIDVYLIAGQSNATGSTNITNADEIYADFPALKTGTAPYIQYAGNSAGNSPNNTVTYDFGDVKLGLGASSAKMGPEVGMAYALSAHYNEQTGKHAAIIKYAHGGTGLVRTEANTEPDENTGKRPGNWEPPSYRPHNPEDPDLSYRGFLYRGFLEEVSLRLYQLKKQGYTKITIKGLYWMQGCNDTWRYTAGEATDNKNPNWYPEAFACLVEDWRDELARIMRVDLKMPFASAQNMPFFIGTISRSYRLDTGKEATEARNLPFIAMQKKLAEDNEKCYIVDNSVYDVMVWDEVNDCGVVVGTDNAHWGQADCYTIGKNVGNAMIENGYK